MRERNEKLLNEIDVELNILEEKVFTLIETVRTKIYSNVGERNKDLIEIGEVGKTMEMSRFFPAR